ncbi:unnamed protein product [Amoebophrya sp. A25]|nr:unnamed protein product [Amoebophrya sp. A25]|eukprot:GSA25T00018498001.1
MSPARLIVGDDGITGGEGSPAMFQDEGSLASTRSSSWLGSLFGKIQNVFGSGEKNGTTSDPEPGLRIFMREQDDNSGDDTVADYFPVDRSFFVPQWRIKWLENSLVSVDSAEILCTRPDEIRINVANLQKKLPYAIRGGPPEKSREYQRYKALLLSEQAARRAKNAYAQTASRVGKTSKRGGTEAQIGEQEGQGAANVDTSTSSGSALRMMEAAEPAEAGEADRFEEVGKQTAFDELKVVADTPSGEGAAGTEKSSSSSRGSFRKPKPQRQLAGKPVAKKIRKEEPEMEKLESLPKAGSLDPWPVREFPVTLVSNAASETCCWLKCQRLQR